MTIGKTITLTRQIFVCKIMSLLFNMLRTQQDSESGGEPFKGEDSAGALKFLGWGLSSSAGHCVGSTKGFCPCGVPSTLVKFSIHPSFPETKCAAILPTAPEAWY